MTHIIAKSLGFALDPELQNFFSSCPLSESQLSVLKDDIRVNGVRNPLLMAALEGSQAVPVLYDGHHRLKIVAELRSEGIATALPPILVQSFPDRQAVIKELISVQIGRRNVSPAPFGYDILKNALKTRQLLQDQAKANLKTNCTQPSARAPKTALDVRKELANLSGLGQRAVGTILRAQEEKPELLNRMLLPSSDKQHLSIRQAQCSLARADNATRKSKAYRVNAERKAAIAAATGCLPVPDLIQPNTLVVGDAVDLLSRVSPESVSLVLTSPPYPIASIEYDAWKYENYAAWLKLMEDIFVGSFKALVKGGRMVLNVDATGAQATGEAMPGQILHNVFADLAALAKKAGFGFFGEICWYKQNVSGGSTFGTNWGTYMSPRAPRIRRNHEYLFVWAKDSGELEGDPLQIDITDDEFKLFSLSQWYIKPAPRKDAKHPDFHPVPFPEELAYRVIRLLTFKGEDSVVLDPFAGSGTVPFVARALGRGFLGFDSSPLYIESAVRRVASLDGLSPEQQLKMIRRFVSEFGSRADGY